MARELETLVARLKVNEADEEAVDFYEGNEESNTELNREYCLLGRVHTDRPYSITGMKQAMKAAWKPRRVVEFQDLENNLFLIKFQHVIDMRRVLDDAPWSFDRNVLVLQPVEGHEQPSEIVLNKVPFWVRFIDLPLNRRNEQSIKTIGSRIGEVKSVDVDRILQGSRQIRERILIDINKPLCRKIPIINSRREQVFISICYERLPNFCYWCDLLGHTSKECLDKPLELGDDNQVEWPYPDSLRASPLKSNRIGKPSYPQGKDNNLSEGHASPSNSACRQLFDDQNNKAGSSPLLGKAPVNSSGTTTGSDEKDDLTKLPMQEVLESADSRDLTGKNHGGQDTQDLVSVYPSSQITNSAHNFSKNPTDLAPPVNAIQMGAITTDMRPVTKSPLPCIIQQKVGQLELDSPDQVTTREMDFELDNVGSSVGSFQPQKIIGPKKATTQGT